MQNAKQYREGDANKPQSKDHNYKALLTELARSGDIVFHQNNIAHTHIAHDDHCDIYSGDYCNCAPDITVGGRLLVRNGRILKQRTRMTHDRL